MRELLSKMRELTDSLLRLLKKWESYYFCFSKAVPFVAGLFFGHGFVDFAYLGFFIVIITDSWGNDNLWRSAIISNIHECLQEFATAIILFYIARELNVRFIKVVASTYAVLFIGVLLVWASTWSSTTSIKMGVLFLAMVPLAVAKSGYAILESFLHAQLERKEESKNGKDETKIEARCKVWRRLAVCSAGYIAVTSLSEAGTSSILMISTIVLGATYVFFFCGIRFYGRTEQTGSQPDNLNSQMKQARPLVRLLPLWTTCLVYAMVDAAGSNLFVEQASDFSCHGDNFALALCVRLSASGFLPLRILIRLTTSFLVGLLIPRLWKQPKKQQRIRLGVGIAVCSGCCTVAWLIEFRRLHSEGNMSLEWYFPQFALLGIAEGLLEDGFEDFFYEHVPDSMKKFEFTSFSALMMGTGKLLSTVCILACRVWIGETVNTSRLDKYYLMLGILSLMSLILYCVLLCIRDWEIVVEDDSRTIVIELDSRQIARKSQSFPPPMSLLPVTRPVYRRSRTLN